MVQTVYVKLQDQNHYCRYTFNPHNYCPSIASSIILRAKYSLRKQILARVVLKTLMPCKVQRPNRYELSFADASVGESH